MTKKGFKFIAVVFMLLAFVGQSSAAMASMCTMALNTDMQTHEAMTKTNTDDDMCCEAVICPELHCFSSHLKAFGDQLVTSSIGQAEMSNVLPLNTLSNYTSTIPDALFRPPIS